MNKEGSMNQGAADPAQQGIVITGASSGIGEALALEAARRGHPLILLARRLDELDRVAQLCLAQGSPRCQTLHLDLANNDSIQDCARQILALGWPLHGLINNAGISQRSTARNADANSELHLMQVNYLGPVFFTKKLLPALPSGGGILVISSVVGLFPFPQRSSYAASKHALHGYFETMALEEKSRLRITIACPGRVRTNISLNALASDGRSHNTMDPGQVGGLDPAHCARLIWSAWHANRRRVLVARGEKVLWWLYRFIPSLFDRVALRVSPV
ncbi:MAG: SDR family NAD(P)-dependent oxidoreductase [Bacteroidota bacterium]